MKKLLFRAEDLKDFMMRFFTRLDMPPEDAEIAADVLLSADLRGIDSHSFEHLLRKPIAPEVDQPLLSNTGNP